MSLKTCSDQKLMANFNFYGTSSTKQQYIMNISLSTTSGQ
uniref:Uncharacterized protein n=1 Tax=Rhizophora mucronata TaxID=61149 RepID=A0A2P2QEW0_RHIMU